MKFLLVLLVAMLAWPAHGAEISWGQTSSTHKNGVTTRATTCCADTTANGSCDTATLTNVCATAPTTGHWTTAMDCRGARAVAAYLGQGAAITGNTNVELYNCVTGYDSTLGPAHATNARYCTELTGRSAVGATSCRAAYPTLYTAHAGTDRCVILEQFSDTDNDTGGGPVYFVDQEGCDQFQVALTNAQTNCITPADIDVQESDSPGVVLPNVWTTVGRITGVIDPLIQLVNFGRPPKGAVRTTHTASADADCTDVHITATLKCPLGQPDLLTDTTPSMSVTPDGGVQYIVAQFSATIGTEASQLDLTCLF